MAPSLCIDLGADERARLLAIARESIRHGLETGRRQCVNLAELGETLRLPCAVFVTLTEEGELRGCIGSLQPSEALAQAVSDAAFGAAFRDYRFPAVGAEDLERIRIEISILSELQPIEIADRETLLRELVPGIDGLLIEDRGHRATFLPKVWEKIASPEEFLQHLMQKAGLPPGHWSPTLRAQRYHTLSFDEA